PTPHPTPATPTPSPEAARAAALEQARTAGILGTIALQQGHAFASLTGKGDISSGFDDRNIFGGLSANEATVPSGGLGLSGYGPGGGGTGWGTIGTGSYGTIGHGSGGGGAGMGYGSGHGRGGAPMHGPPEPSVHLGVAGISGALDKQIVRRYIRGALPNLKSCYAPTLDTDPTLRGTLRVILQIDADGAVSSADAHGLRGDIDTCIADALRAIQFPAADGTTEVDFPVEFTPVAPR
ncbi:MAG TPA: AgmX/PglI C-terminal domain-containing protein, partial [Kofleriaceae bacterium]|nr:AgmX/PglI C-terminal domain-containing protein [Kofleriaceae bacterium]